MEKRTCGRWTQRCRRRLPQGLLCLHRPPRARIQAPGWLEGRLVQGAKRRHAGRPVLALHHVHGPGHHPQQRKLRAHRYDEAFGKHLRQYSLEPYKGHDLRTPYLVKHYDFLTGEALSDGALHPGRSADRRARGWHRLPAGVQLHCHGGWPRAREGSSHGAVEHGLGEQRTGKNG